MYILNMMGGKYEVILIEGLHDYAREQDEGMPKVQNLPSKEEFINFLTKLKEKQIMNTKKQFLDSVIHNIDIFYQGEF